MNYMTVEKLSTLWFDDVGEKFDTYEEVCVDHFYHLIRCMPVEFFESVETHGILDPLRILIDENNEAGLSNGHHRFIVAVILGITSVPIETAHKEDEWVEHTSGVDARAWSNPIKDHLDYGIEFVGTLW